MIRLNYFHFLIAAIITLMLHQNSVAQGLWKVQNPLPTESFLLTVEPVTDNKIFLGGFGGTLLKTTDTGNTWTVEKFQNLVNIKSIKFTDSINGWLLDGEHLFHTIDGGNNWTEVFIDADMSTYYFMDIICFENILYLLLKPQTVAIWELPTAKSLIYKSTDSGQTWVQLEQEIKGKMNGAFFINENIGFIVVEETISISESYTCFYKTNNGGITWNNMIFSGGYIGVEPGIFFQSEEVGFIEKYRTTDGGLSWVNRFNSLDSLKELVTDICLTDSINGWAISGTKILQTSDGGLTWSDTQQYSSHKLKDINFSKNGTGWIVGWAGNIFKKNAETNSWQQISEGIKHTLNDVFFIDKNEGWCVGTAGSILHTSNGGKIWEIQESNIDSVLYSIKFVNNLEGWIAGHYVVLHTIDGGKNWNTRNDLHGWFVDVDFFDAEVGLLIDRSGKIYNTTNGGIDWQISNQNIFPRLTSVTIKNENEAWIGGWQGFGHTTDRGITVNWYDVPNISLVRDIQFVDENLGFLINDFSLLLCTKDGGWNWTEIPREGELETGPIDACYMIDQNNGWIYWDYKGGYLKKVNINHTINTIESDYYSISFINKIYFADSLNGWAVGAGGTILKYTKNNSTGITKNSAKSKTYIFNYPNPFRRNGTNISFSLINQQHVSIHIYNSIGQKICTLFDRIANAGENSISWIPARIAAGIYFISVQCKEFNQLKKCLFLKY